MHKLWNFKGGQLSLGVTLPDNFDISPSKEARRDDFPEPTLPTTVIRAPRMSFNSMFLRVGTSDSGSQLKEASSTLTAKDVVRDGSFVTAPS